MIVFCQVKVYIGSVKTNIFEDGFCDRVLHGDVDQLDVLGVGGASRLHEDLPVVRIRIFGSETIKHMSYFNPENEMMAFEEWLVDKIQLHSIF